MQNSSLLPKLLAKENVTIQHGNFSTAWFDIKNRVLGLPIWKEMHKDEYDLFTGHEVGHALETPYEGWHDSPEKLKGCPRSYINVVEDARIERKMQARYPGLIGSFTRGYARLLEREFFGDLSNVDYDTVKLIDKINLKSKLGTKLDVIFSDEEIVFYNRAMTTDTFQEVLDLVRDILAFTKENTPELIEQPEQSSQEDGEESQDIPSGHDDWESEGEEEKEKDDFDKLMAGELDSDTPSTNDTTSSSDDGDEESKSWAETVKEFEEMAAAMKDGMPVHGKYQEYQEDQEEDKSLTDEIFRAKEETLIDTDSNGHQPMVIDEINKEILAKCVIPYKKLSEARATHQIIEYPTSSNECFKKYMKSVKGNVTFAVREFEMRKSAYQNTRATTAKTGTIDVNKLWSYKTSEDIFLQSTKLANAKNHGMMLLIDLSGSMSGSMKYVMDQVIHLIVFCKSTNIPFEVYGFTSTNPDITYEDEAKLYSCGHMGMDELCMPLLCSSSLKKTDYLEAMHSLFRRTVESGWSYNRHCAYEDWGSTPLNQALTVSHHLVKKFKAKHQTEKMNFITFTDGDANRLQVSQRTNEYNEDKKTEFNRESLKMKIDGKMLESSRSSRHLTTSLLSNMKKRYNTNNLGFFMAETNNEWRHRQYIMADLTMSGFEEIKKEFSAQYRKNKCVTFNDVLGYSEYYLVKGGKNLDTTEDEFSTDEGASQASIRNAFKKYAKSKKLNKVLMTKFGKAVA